MTKTCSWCFREFTSPGMTINRHKHEGDRCNGDLFLPFERSTRGTEGKMMMLEQGLEMDTQDVRGASDVVRIHREIQALQGRISARNKARDIRIENHSGLRVAYRGPAAPARARTVLGATYEVEILLRDTHPVEWYDIGDTVLIPLVLDNLLLKGMAKRWRAFKVVS